MILKSIQKVFCRVFIFNLVLKSRWLHLWNFLGSFTDLICQCLFPVFFLQFSQFWSTAGIPRWSLIQVLTRLILLNFKSPALIAADLNWDVVGIFLIGGAKLAQTNKNKKRRRCRQCWTSSALEEIDPVARRGHTA